MKKRIPPQEFRRLNEEYFEKYPPTTLYYHGNPLIRGVERRRAFVAASLCNMDYNDSYKLDVGCGEGFATKDLEGFVVGLDLSKKALAFAKNTFCKGFKYSLVLGEASSLPFVDKAFKVILCSEVLEHVPHPKKALSEIARVASNNAYVIITLPIERNIAIIKKIFKKVGISKKIFYNLSGDVIDKWHLHQISPHEIIRILERWGFRAKLRKRIPIFYPIRYILSFERREYTRDMKKAG